MDRSSLTYLDEHFSADQACQIGLEGAGTPAAVDIHADVTPEAAPTAVKRTLWMRMCSNWHSCPPCHHSLWSYRINAYAQKIGSSLIRCLKCASWAARRSLCTDLSTENGDRQFACRRRSCADSSRDFFKRSSTTVVSKENRSAEAVDVEEKSGRRTHLPRVIGTVETLGGL
jgi:hypothetical protein